jgi:hypothetical protein
MTRSHPHFSRTNAIAAAVACLLLATSAQAGVIADSNPTTGGAFAGECGTSGAAEACVGAWNLGNVDVQQVHADGTVFGSFSTTNGAYATMVAGDSFISSVKDAMGSVMAKVTGKVWPIGEPAGIKAVNSDTQTKNGKPQNCLINSSYLGADVSTSGLDAYLNSSAPEPVICSSGFQSHKRFKIAMQPASVDGVADGAASTKPIDMVFNVTDGGGLKPYQVFSKINNYTGKRLKGYKIVVGRGTGSGFQTASELGIAEKLHISLGKGEGYSSGSMGAPNGSDLFDGDGLATFSHGLFGAIDTNFPSNGFFDTRTAGFDVEQLCTSAAGTAPGTCPTGYTGPDGNATLMNSDTIQSTTVLASNYTSLFGDWLPSKWQPSGVFYDDDNDPSTDAVLKAWWNGSQWVGNNDGGSAPIPAATLDAWGQDRGRAQPGHQLHLEGGRRPRQRRHDKHVDVHGPHHPGSGHQPGRAHLPGRRTRITDLTRHHASRDLHRWWRLQRCNGPTTDRSGSAVARRTGSGGLGLASQRPRRLSSNAHAARPKTSLCARAKVWATRRPKSSPDWSSNSE